MKLFNRLIGIACITLLFTSSFATENRGLGGKGNNVSNPGWGVSSMSFLNGPLPPLPSEDAFSIYDRLDYGLLPNNAYLDGMQEPARPTILGFPNVRTASNVLSKEQFPVDEPLGFNDMLIWWFFIVHIDIGLNVSSPFPGEDANIPVPKGDPDFDPDNTGEIELFFNRTLSTNSVGIPGVRESFNLASSYLDNLKIKDLHRLEGFYAHI